MSALKALSNMKLSKRLPTIMIFLTFIALTVSIIVSYFNFSYVIHSEADSKTQSIAAGKKFALELYLGSLVDDIKAVSHSGYTYGALKDFKAGWNKIKGNKSKTLKNLYITKNPHPTGQKEKLDYAKDGSDYSKAHKKYHPWFRSLLQERGYYDVFLIDMKGNLIYSVFKELDYATNLNYGKWKDTDLGNAFRAAKKLKENEVSFFDFKPYAPSNGAAAGFMSTPIVEGGRTVGVLVFQMPVDNINAVFKESSGLGETGESYIVGEDFLLRNDSRLSEETTILVRKEENEAVKRALAGESGSIILEKDSINYIISYLPFEYLGAKFALIAEIQEDELMEPAYLLRTELILLLIILMAITGTVSMFISKGIVKYVLATSSNLASLAKKDSDFEVIGTERVDELGDMANSVKELQKEVKLNKEKEEEASKIAAANARIKVSLDCVSSNVMIADAENVIIYMNPSVCAMLQAAESDIKKDLPKFDSSKLIGCSIDEFHKDPSHQQRMLKDLSSTYTTSITVGGRIFDLIANPVKDDNGVRLGTVVEWTDVTQERAVEQDVEEIVQSAANGDFTKRLETEGRQGFMLTLSQGINQISETANQGLNETVEVLESLSGGDLKKIMEGDYNGSFDDIKRALNTTIKQLKSTVITIKDSASFINSASKEISTGSKDLSERTEQQASTLEETAASMDELTGAVKQNTENSNSANSLTEKAKDIATQGGDMVERAVVAMGGITESSQKISDIIGVIDDIAFQTNLLALNAAVEAARAGDAGKGFAVVASEVRSLAGRSASASKDIKALIMESSDKVKTGSELVNQSGETLQDIVASITEVAGIISEIASASTQQATGIEEINSAVSQMDEMTQQNAALVEENTAATQSLVNQVYELEDLMKFFSVDKDDGAQSADERDNEE